MINNISFQNNDKIKQFGKTDDGRLIIGTKDNETGKYIKSTIPEDNFDEFEKLTNDTKDKYGKYLKNNYQKATQLIYATNISAAAIGGAIAATCMKKASRAKTFFGTLGGAFAGVIVASTAMAAFLISKLITFAKNAKALDIRPYQEPNIPHTDENKTDNKTETTNENNKEIKNEKPKDE